MLVTIFAPGNVHLLEIAGLRDAFFEANCKMQSGKPYRVRLVTEHGTPTESASGVIYIPDAGISDAAQHAGSDASGKDLRQQKHWRFPTLKIFARNFVASLPALISTTITSTSASASRR